jgi:hypothetical protein
MAGEGKFIDNLMAGNIVTAGTVTAENTGADIVALITTASVTPAQSGKIFTLGLAGGFTVTLPRPVAGLNYRFIVKVAPTTAYIIATAGSANIMYGVVASAEDAAGSVGCAAASDTLTFVANKALIGDSVEIISDGTNWYVRGGCNVQDAITLTQAT